MRIKLDRTVCDGFGTCAEHAPELFSMDEWGYPSLVGTGDVTELQEAPARRALLDCPAPARGARSVRPPVAAGGAAGVGRRAAAAREAREGRAEPDAADQSEGRGSGAPW